jgi:hypothetical protein
MPLGVPMQSSMGFFVCEAGHNIHYYIDDHSHDDYHIPRSEANCI